VYCQWEASTDMHAAPLDKIQYVDYPELRINKNESTEMPFRYVKGKNGESIIPEVSQDKHVQRPA
jgi:ribosome biogenesis SPOUT family RNA methylase Rps3